MTKPELFWRLFQSSGHVGAYLLYVWYQRRSASEGTVEELGGGDRYQGETATLEAAAARGEHAALTFRR